MKYRPGRLNKRDQHDSRLPQTPVCYLDAARARTPLPEPGWKPFLSYAFRPFYLLAALQLVLFVGVWSFDVGGTRALPGFLWHGHEMIWGYAGAIIVGFLLTAVATWTGQSPTRGAMLALLVVTWLLARAVLVAYADSNLPGGLLSVLFFALATLCLAKPIVRTRNRRNYVVIALLAALGLANLLFHLAVAGILPVNLRMLLHLGMLLVAVVICFMGMRVIAFFTSRALGIEQVRNARIEVVLAVGLPFAMTLAVAIAAPGWMIAALGVGAAAVNLRQLVRWWHPGVLRVPLLWVLFAGYGWTVLGLAFYALAVAWQPAYMSTALHVLAVGGMGLLTLGMMTRTALGHTGRPLKAPSPLPAAFLLVLVAAVLRLLAGLSVPSNQILVAASGLLFCLAFALYLYRFGPWLIRPRADGKP